MGGGGLMGIKKVAETVGRYMAKFFSDRADFTGKLVITFHCRQGGVGKIEVEIKHDLRQWDNELDKG